MLAIISVTPASMPGATLLTAHPFTKWALPANSRTASPALCTTHRVPGARWYHPVTGTLAQRAPRRDPFEGYPNTPYSLHQYQYGYSNPALFTDPSGMAPLSSCNWSKDIVGWECTGTKQAREVVFTKGFDCDITLDGLTAYLGSSRELTTGYNIEINVGDKAGGTGGYQNTETVLAIEDELGTELYRFLLDLQGTLGRLSGEDSSLDRVILRLELDIYLTPRSLFGPTKPAWANVRHTPGRSYINGPFVVYSRFVILKLSKQGNIASNVIKHGSYIQNNEAFLAKGERWWQMIQLFGRIKDYSGIKQRVVENKFSFTIR